MDLDRQNTDVCTVATTTAATTTVAAGVATISTASGDGAQGLQRVRGQNPRRQIDRDGVGAAAMLGQRAL